MDELRYFSLGTWWMCRLTNEFFRLLRDTWRVGTCCLKAFNIHQNLLIKCQDKRCQLPFECKFEARILLRLFFDRLIEVTLPLTGIHRLIFLNTKFFDDIGLIDCKRKRRLNPSKREHQ